VDVELIEVLVGDETKSGFGINFWLPPSEAVQGDMRNVLSGLRAQDVVFDAQYRSEQLPGQGLRTKFTKRFDKDTSPVSEEDRSDRLRWML